MGSEQQVVRMDTVRDLSSALWSLRTSQEAARLLRTSLSLLRCFLFFDICYLIGGITLISMALSNQVNDQENRIVFAGVASIFPPRPCFSFPPPRSGVLRAPPEAEVGAPVPIPGHLLPLLLLAPHPQAVPGHGLPSPRAGCRRSRVGGARLPQTCYCPLPPW